MKKYVKSSEENTKTLHVYGNCTAIFEGTIQVPSSLSLEEAVDYANTYLDEIKVTHVEDTSEYDINPEDIAYGLIYFD